MINTIEAAIAFGYEIAEYFLSVECTKGLYDLRALYSRRKLRKIFKKRIGYKLSKNDWNYLRHCLDGHVIDCESENPFGETSSVPVRFDVSGRKLRVGVI